MQYKATTIDDYFAQLPEDRLEPMAALWQTIQENIPEGFEAAMQYSMPAFVVPLSTYPAGYHCTPDTPLPFLSIASQKNFIALYHMGIYANQELLDWFTSEYPNHSKTKLDMGKSCIRFKKVNELPLKLIAELISKMTVQQWTAIYEKALKK